MIQNAIFKNFNREIKKFTSSKKKKANLKKPQL